MSLINSKWFYTLIVAFVFSTTASAWANSTETLLLRTPTVSDAHIAFAYAGDIWLTDDQSIKPLRVEK